MIQVRVEFLGSLGSELGEVDRIINLKEGSTIGDLIEKLIEILPKGDKFKRIVLDDQGNKRQYVLLMMNYKQLYKDPLKVDIHDKAKVVFAMPSAGG